MKKFSSKGTIGAFDLRTPEEKAKDFKFIELVSAPVKVTLSQTSPEKWGIYPKRNQDGSNTCVYQSRAKAAGILQEQKTGSFIEYSAADYNLRSNKDTPGSSPVEAFDFWRKNGIGLEHLEPSQNIDDVGVAKIKQSEFAENVALISTLDSYYTLPLMDFDTLVSTLHATKKPISLCFYATYKEWNRDIPELIDGITVEQAEVRHSICATPNYGIWQGKEGFTIEDSWGSSGIGGTGVRWISRAFMARNYIAGLVPTSFKDYVDLGIKPNKPKHTFGKVLVYGMINDSDVAALQDVLKFEGFFPANHASTGNYFEITRRAIDEFQRFHEIASVEELNELKGRTVGKKTLSVLNKKYA